MGPSRSSWALKSSVIVMLTSSFSPSPVLADAAPDPGPVGKVVAEHESAGRERARGAGSGEPGRIARRRLPRVPAPPEAVDEPRRDYQRDGEDQRPAGRVVQG